MRGDVIAGAALHIRAGSATSGATSATRWSDEDRSARCSSAGGWGAESAIGETKPGGAAGTDSTTGSLCAAIVSRGAVLRISDGNSRSNSARCAGVKAHDFGPDPLAASRCSKTASDNLGLSAGPVVAWSLVALLSVGEAAGAASFGSPCDSTSAVCPFDFSAGFTLGGLSAVVAAVKRLSYWEVDSVGGSAFLPFLRRGEIQFRICSRVSSRISTNRNPASFFDADVHTTSARDSIKRADWGSSKLTREKTFSRNGSPAVTDIPVSLMFARIPPLFSPRVT